MKRHFTLILFLFTTILSYAQTPWLHVEGNKIKDPAGNVVVLRGVAIQDIVGQYQEQQIGFEGLIDLITNTNDTAGASPGWYPKVVRLTINPVYGDLQTYFDNYLKPAVDYVTSKGLYVIIDYHFIADVQGNVDNTNRFWSFVAPRFANQSNVFYEVYNEPINTTWSWATYKPYMQKWIDLIRKYAPHNLILAGSPSWDQQMSGSVNSPFVGNNIVYVAHLYANHFASSSIRKNVEQTAAKYPVFMTEWGYRDALDWGPDETVSGMGNHILEWADTLGLSWTAWCADNDWEPAMFTYNWKLRVSEGDMGGLVKDALYDRRNDDVPADVHCNAPVLGQNQSICGKSSITINTMISKNGKTFTWLKDRAPLPDSDSLLVATVPGIYTVQVDTNGCIMSDEIEIIDTLFPISLGPDLLVNDTITLSATNSNDPYDYKWYKNNVLLPNDTTYALKIMDTCKTSFKLEVSYPGCGTVSDQFNILCLRDLFLGHRLQIPGTIQTEDFDIGNAPNLTYYDSDNGNNGGGYREGNVDIETAKDINGGYNVGWTAVGEWLEYSITVSAPGYYAPSYRVASNNATAGKFRLEFNHQNLTGTVTVPITGGWQTWTTISGEPIYLTPQDTVMRMYIEGGGINLNYFSFADVTATTSPNQVSQITIYPNPVQDMIYLNGVEEKTEWVILNILGDEILRGNGTTADASTLMSGTYIIKVGNSNFKFVK